jgi:hypothetical protein
MLPDDSAIVFGFGRKMLKDLVLAVPRKMVRHLIYSHMTKAK